MPEPLQDVIVAQTFPNFAQASQIVVGEEVTTLITLRNERASNINVTYITGSINSDKAFNIYLHNFTTRPYYNIVPPKGEQSLEYRFATPINMPARQFRLAMTVFYKEDGPDAMQHAATFFNSTVEVIEPERLVDTEALGLYLTLLGLAAAIGYVIYCTVKEMPWFKEVSKKATRKKGGVVADVPETADKSEWLTGTPHDVLQRKKGGKKGK